MSEPGVKHISAIQKYVHILLVKLNYPPAPPDILLAISTTESESPRTKASIRAPIIKTAPLSIKFVRLDFAWFFILISPYRC